MSDKKRLKAYKIIFSAYINIFLYNMPYSLRSRIENALFEEEEEEDFGGNPSEKEDNVSEQSDAEETDSELENSIYVITGSPPFS